MRQQVMRLGRRIGIAIAGGAVITVGVVLAMPLVPGPGSLLIVLGIAILSQEFEKPRVWMGYIKVRGLKLKNKLKDIMLRKRPESGGN